MSEAAFVERVGVVGAGTMGAGIAQLAAMGGYATLLHDPFPEALEAGVERIGAGLAKGAEKGRWGAQDAEAARRRLQAAPELDGLGDCQLVIEAVPERLELKHDLFRKLSELCDPEAVLATNTSSLPVTAIATVATDPSRVVGMHFFNPPVLMELLEVVAGTESSEQALAVAKSVGERMGRRVIVAADGPGFLANRCARPFGLEALKLLQEGIADHATIDRVVRLGGGFRMGPFELMDLVGLDVGFEVTKSFWEQSFHEPRWRPSMITERYVQAGRLGRKTGRGYYEYPADGPPRPADPAPPQGATGAASMTIAIDGDGSLANQLRELAAACGHHLVELDSLDTDEQPSLIVDANVGRDPSDLVLGSDDPGTAVCILCVDGSLAELDVSGNAIGFHALAPLEHSGLVELVRSAGAGDDAAGVAERFFSSLGKRTEWVGDAPGLVLGRIVCQLVNEAAFALTEGVGSAADIDVAMRYGYNHPRGPLEWADTIELDQVLATLDALATELGEDRYRAAPLLRRMVAEGRLGRSTGEGFFGY